MSGFDLKDYVDVKERIRLFYAAHPDGRLVTEDVIASQEPDEVPRIWVKALAYRTPDDPHPGVGWSWLILPGSTPYTRGSEIENAETSAWGRAIGSLGIGIDASIASADEVAAKEGEGDRKAPRARRTVQGARKPADEPGVRHGPENSLIGTVEARKPPADMELRQTPEGMAYGFGLVGPGGKGRMQVIAVGALAETINTAGLSEGEKVTLWGRQEMVEWIPAGAKEPRHFWRLHLDRIQTEEWTLPAPEQEPLFDEAEQRAIDEALARKREP